MKKIFAVSFCIALFSFSFQLAGAADLPVFTNATQCAESSPKAACNGSSLDCGTDEIKIGTCEWNNPLAIFGDGKSACCAPKENTVLATNGVAQNTSNSVSANVDAEKIPVVDCAALKGTCKINGTIRTDHACDNNSDSSDANGKEDYLGYCSTGVGDATSAGASRQDCCVPHGSVTKDALDKALVGQWVSSDICEAPANKGGYGGSCNLAFTDCSGDTPVKVGYCGSLGGNALCCTSAQNAKEVGVSTVDSGVAAPLEYGDYQLLESIPGSSNDASDLPTYLQNIYQAGLVLIVLGAIFMIGMGGFTYIASAGNTHTMAKGKGMIQDALYGLIVALATWLILNIINPDLVNLTIETPGTLDFTAYGGMESNESSAPIGGSTGGGNNCNGVPSDADLETFPKEATTGDPERATKDTVKRFLEMRAAAAKENVNLKVSDGFRSESEQVALWNQFCGSGSCGAKKVARPCTKDGGGSNHQSGKALDISVGCGNGQQGCRTKAYLWLKSNGGKFGFLNDLPTDPPHWSPTGH